jgi:SAM-dependent methyltransferase
LEGGRFGLVAVYNVLDHVHDPAALAGKAHRLLRPGGVLLLGCDVFSLVGIVRFHAYLERREPDSIRVRAHPFRFRPGAWPSSSAPPASASWRALQGQRALAVLVGHSRRALMLCEKPG